MKVCHRHRKYRNALQRLRAYELFAERSRRLHVELRKGLDLWRSRRDARQCPHCLGWTEDPVIPDPQGQPCRHAHMLY